MEGSLNIDYHIKRLVMIALGRYNTLQSAADALGVTVNTLKNYKKKYSL